MNYQNLRLLAHKELDKAIDEAAKANLPDGIFDVQLVHTTTDSNEKTTITRIGSELTELADGTFEVEEPYTRQETH